MKILWPWPWGRYSFANPLFLLSLLLFDSFVNPLSFRELNRMKSLLPLLFHSKLMDFPLSISSQHLQLPVIVIASSVNIAVVECLLWTFYWYILSPFLFSFYSSPPSPPSPSPLFSISVITSPISPALHNWYELRSLRAIGAWWYDIPRKARTWQLSSRWGPHK